MDVLANAVAAENEIPVRKTIKPRFVGCSMTPLAKSGIAVAEISKARLDPFLNERNAKETRDRQR